MEENNKQYNAIGVIGFIACCIFGFIPMNVSIALIGCIIGGILCLCGMGYEEGKGWSVAGIIIAIFGIIGALFIL